MPGDVASGLGVRLGEIGCSSFSLAGTLWFGDNTVSSVSVEFDVFTSGFIPTSLSGIDNSFEIISVLAELVNVTFAISSWIVLFVKVLFSSAFPEV